MVIAHLGVAVVTFGVAMVSGFVAERDVRMQVGDVQSIGGYEFHLKSLSVVEGPNWVADQANMEITKDGEFVALVTPQKRKYNVSGQIMTEAGIHNRWDGDLFVAMGEPLEGAWAIRLRIKPFINMMWLGAVIMGIGGVWAMFDARYRVSLGQRVACRSKGNAVHG